MIYGLDFYDCPSVNNLWDYIGTVVIGLAGKQVIIKLNLHLDWRTLELAGD